MKFSIGETVRCNTEIRKNGRKYILVHEPQEDTVLSSDIFQVVGRNQKNGMLTLLVEDDVVGFMIDDYKIKDCKISEFFKGKKYFDVPIEFIMKDD